MVDWDRVEELRSKGWDWAKIADDPKVGFHAEAAAGSPDRALRALYHRSQARIRRAASGPNDSRPAQPSDRNRWTLLRLGYLTVPLVAVWFLLAYLAPSPVGLLFPALPYLGLALAVVAFAFAFGLVRSGRGRRWSSVYRGTLVGGVVLGLVLAGLIGLTGTLLFGCPYLPSAASLTPLNEPTNVSGWERVPVATWQDSGRPVFFYYGAVWCPYCSASSWAMWKAFVSFGSGVASSAFSDYSSNLPTESFRSTPEVVLADPRSSSDLSAQVDEYTGGVDGATPGTSSCYQQAYVSAYAGTGIPFIVIDGVYVHLGTLYSPSGLSPWAAGANGGDIAVKNSVYNETPATSGGNPWSTVHDQAWWMMALAAKATGQSPAFLASTYGWSSTTQGVVTSELTTYLA